MWFHFVFFLVLCQQWHPSASTRLRREGGGKEAAMDDVLKVAQGAHKAAEIYAQAKHAASSNSAANDVYLVLRCVICSAHAFMAVPFICCEGKCYDAWKLRSGCIYGGGASWRHWSLPRVSARLCGCMSWGAKSKLLASMAFYPPFSFQGWIATQTSGSCKALDSDYAGPCPLELFVEQMTANDKANMEIRWLGHTCQSFCMSRMGLAPTGAQFAGLVNKMLAALKFPK